MRERRTRGPVLVLLTVALVLAACDMRQMLYPAPPYRVPSQPPAPLEEAVWELADGTRIVGWAGGAGAAPGAPAVVFFHGNGENLETMRLGGLYDDLDRLGVAWLAVDYPGYGRSGGSPSEASLVEAAEGGFAELSRRFQGRPRVVCGWSLGAAVAVQLAANHAAELDGLMLLSPWTDLPSLAGEHFPGWLVSLLLRERYDSIGRAAELSLPTLVVHGADDSIIPVEHGRRLAAALPAARYLEVADAGHNDLLARPVVWQAMADYLRAGGGR
jgi:pimeloyl-ACP methyl ester carboxylesterase